MTEMILSVPEKERTPILEKTLAEDKTSPKKDRTSPER